MIDFPYSLKISSPGKSRGFTLIEIIVVVTIMMILSTTGIASFVTYTRTQDLTNGTQNFVTVLQVAKASAASQVKPNSDNCSSSRPLDGYAVTINPGNGYTAGSNTYSVAPVCRGVVDSVETREYALPVNLRFALVAPLTITFHIINGKVTFSSGETAYADVVIQNGQMNDDINPTPPQNGLKVIRVYEDGRIHIQ